MTDADAWRWERVALRRFRWVGPLFRAAARPGGAPPYWLAFLCARLVAAHHALWRAGIEL